MDTQYENIKRTFKAKCINSTKLHKVGKIYNCQTFVKLNSWIYVLCHRESTKLIKKQYMQTNIPFKSQKQGKKYSVYAFDGKKTHLVHFGAAGYSDFTQHKDESRKKRYLIRHKANEDWTKKGIFTAGFWSRWVLWNKETVAASVADTVNRFSLKTIQLPEQ